MKVEKNLKLKLASILMKFGTYETDKGTLLVEGDLAVGKEAYLVTGEEDPVQAPDDTYLFQGKLITIVGGLIESIEDETPVEMKVTEEEVEDKLEEALGILEEVKEELETLKSEFSAYKARQEALQEKFSAFCKEPKDKPISNKKQFSSTGESHLSEILKQKKL